MKSMAEKLSEMYGPFAPVPFLDYDADMRETAERAAEVIKVVKRDADSREALIIAMLRVVKEVVIPMGYLREVRSTPLFPGIEYEYRAYDDAMVLRYRPIPAR